MSEVGEAIWGTSNIQHPTPNIEVGKEDMAAVADRRYIHEETAREVLADGHRPRPTFDADKASQARAEFIKATIIFFGLDGECLCHPGNLGA